jgi:hypothetical protein
MAVTVAATLLTSLAAPALAAPGRQDAGAADTAVAAHDRTHVADDATTTRERDCVADCEPDRDRDRLRDGTRDGDQVRDRDRDGDDVAVRTRTRVCDGLDCPAAQTDSPRQTAWRLLLGHQWEKLYQLLQRLFAD